MTILDERGGPARITLTEVAHHAGVSRSTVSLVLRGSPLVAAETRERVQAAIAALGYVYNRGAATLRAARTDTVGLLVCEINNSFYGELTAGVDDVLGEQGVVAFLANTAESGELLVDDAEWTARSLADAPADAGVGCGRELFGVFRRAVGSAEAGASVFG
ncbi:LacI family DNA-binding transcriptional regulator [Azospirillum baldaniorum]|uniref:Transcriptional regulator, LacI family n=1 Tax=Azospirillum baldaniorum TaxID=1064539 RepID=A0A9P1NNL1_9PROT